MHERAQRMKEPTGFSLVELLVVIAIVSFGECCDGSFQS